MNEITDTTAYLDDLNAIDELLDSCLESIYKEKGISNIEIEAKSELSDGTNVGPSLVVHDETNETINNINTNINKENGSNTNSQSVSNTNDTVCCDGERLDFNQPIDAIKWDDDVIKLFKEKFPNKDIYNMSLEDLKHLRDDVEALREEFSLIELAYKVLSNGAYGASANAKGFYFYNLAVAGDITGECRALTKYFWTHLEEFFHETIWERKDLWEKFGFELDESKRELCRSLPVSCYSDTDSVSGDSFIYIKSENNSFTEQKITLSDFKSLLETRYGCIGHETENGQIMYSVPDEISVLNIIYKENNNGNVVEYEPKWCCMRYLMCHKVNKPLYKINTNDNKSVITTGDHSIIVKRNDWIGEVSTEFINKETDKLVVLK